MLRQTFSFLILENTTSVKFGKNSETVNKLSFRSEVRAIRLVKVSVFCGERIQYIYVKG